MTPDQYRREGFQAGIDAAANARGMWFGFNSSGEPTGEYCTVKAHDPGGMKLYISHDAIRATDVAEVLAKVGGDCSEENRQNDQQMLGGTVVICREEITPDAVARLMEESDNLLPAFLATAARNIDFDGPWDDFDLVGGLRSALAEIERLDRAALAAMEDSHDRT